MAVTVYRYRCRSWVDLDDDAMQQLRLAHELKNDLVEAQRDYEQQVGDLWMTVPDVAAAQTVVDDRDQHVRELLDRSGRERVTDRSTVPRPETETDLAAARKARRSAADTVKELKDAHRAEVRKERKPLDRQLKARTASRDLYAHWTSRGLGWGTYNRVTRIDHANAVKRVTSLRQQGRPAQFRFHRWTGEGTITVQTQGRPVYLLEPGVSREQWTGRPTKSGITETNLDKHRVLTLHVGRARGLGALTVRVPIVYQRPLPDDAKVLYVSVTRRLLGGKPQISVMFTLDVPEPKPPGTGEVATVRLHWDHPVEGDRIRVANITGNLPDPPEHIQPLLVPLVGGAWDLYTHPVWERPLDRTTRIRSRRDEMLDDLRPQLVAALTEDPEVGSCFTVRDGDEQRPVTAADVMRWRSHARFAALASKWPAEHSFAAKFWAWRDRDRHLWQFEANERDQAIGRRRHAYKDVAAWITGNVDGIALHGLGLADVRRKPAEGQDDPYAARGGRRQATRGAPGELRSVIESAAQRRGVEVLKVEESRSRRKDDKSTDGVAEETTQEADQR